MWTAPLGCVYTHSQPGTFDAVGAVHPNISPSAWRFPREHGHRKRSNSGACGTMGPGLRRDGEKDHGEITALTRRHQLDYSLESRGLSFHGNEPIPGGKVLRLLPEVPKGGGMGPGFPHG